MKYHSTRGGQENLNFGDVALTGLANDGGLFLPDTIPTLAPFNDDVTFFDVAAAVCKPFVVGTAIEDDIENVLRQAWGDFEASDVAPLESLYDNISLLELFHGPSLAFKDFGLRFLAQLFGRIQDRHSGDITILTATSGDTGAAAVSAFAGIEGVRLYVLFPKGRISDIQRRQMTVFAEEVRNIHPLMVDGTFDDCQRIVKECLTNQPAERTSHLTTVNSINWARILGQITYYFWAAHQCRTDEKPPHCFVPTGNFGDAFAGYFARLMGARLGPIHCATNENRMLVDIVEYGRSRGRKVAVTNSPAMDIQVPSNFERLLYYALDEDRTAVSAFFNLVAANGNYELDERCLRYIRNHISASAVSSEDTRLEIKHTYEKSKIVIDPHTAVGVCAANRFDTAGARKIVLATAHPAKFQDTIEDAISIKAPIPSQLDYLSVGEERYTEMAADGAALKKIMGRE